MLVTVPPPAPSQYLDSGCPGYLHSILLERWDLRIRIPEFGVHKESNSPAPKWLPFMATPGLPFHICHSGFAIPDSPFWIRHSQCLWSPPSSPKWTPEETVETQENAERIPKSPPQEAVAAFPSPYPMFLKSWVMISSSEIISPMCNGEFHCCHWN